MKLLRIKNLPIFFLPVLLISFVLHPVYAQEETAQTLQSIEDQRTADLEKQLALTIPKITDNPNHILTFTDPSEEKEGVQLEIDGQGFKKVSSPYTLPSLGIGQHTLTFRFTDDEETRQTLEKSLVVVPRPPIINAPQSVSTTEMTITGTALVASQVDIFLAGGTVNQKATVDVATDGTWTHTFEGAFPLQVYNVVAVTKKNGFASSFSETVVFALAEDTDGNNNVKTLTPIHFAFEDLTVDNLRTNISNNLDLLYLVIATFLLGAGITSLYVLARRNKRQRKIEGNFLQFLGAKDSQKPEKGSTDKVDAKKMTLREKFEQAGLGNNEEKKQEEEPSEEVGMSKEEFMEEYRDQDPDNNKGEEKKKKVKKGKNVKVSLTSK